MLINNNSNTKIKVKKVKLYSSLCLKLHTVMGVCMPYGISPSYPPPGMGTVSRPYPSRYSIYPPIKDVRLSRSEPTQINNLHGVTTEVPAIPGVS